MPKKKSIPVVEEPSYEVECINAARVTDDSQWEYNIKWGGYSDDENSWEPETNLNGCARLMTEFWKQVGPDNKSRAKYFPVEHEVSPSTLWIANQREAYQKTQARKKTQRNKLKSSKANDAQHEKTTKIARDAERQQPKQPPPGLNDSDDDDVPLSLKVVHRHQAPITNITVGVSDAEARVGSSSKRKRDDGLSPEPPNKRTKATPAGEPHKRSALDSKSSAENVQAAIATSHQVNDIVPRRTCSPSDSLFDGGSGSESEDVPLASKSSTPLSRPSAQPTKSQSTKVATQPPTPAEKQPKEKPKVPLHIQRKQNPRIKTMDLPVLDVNMGGLSTKNRIFSQSAARSAGSSLARISLPDRAGGPSSEGLGGSTIIVENLDTPTSAVVTPGVDANAWLKENILPKEELAHAPVDDSRPSSAEPSSSTALAQPVPRFSKRWRWNGQLAVGDNETGFAEPAGSIVITDSTILDRNAGKLSFEALLPSHVDTICLHHQYSLSVLRTALRDFKISQFAIMTADQSADENAFSDVVSYMSKHELFSQSPLTIADLEAATMFVFPSTSQHLLDSLRVPPKVRQGNGLIVAVGFKTYLPPKRTLGGAVATYKTDWKNGPKLDLGSETRTPDCSRALLALNFPDSLFLRLAGKHCTIFTTHSDKSLPGHDSLALIIVLENASGCKVVPVLTGTARFIFIHVTAWDMLHKLPGLVDRRLRRPDVQFYTYGSDPSVERKRWGVHEVFPLGGIVTFTPRAIVEDPTGVEQLIAKLDEHPLWACYILPSVIPMICEVAAENESTYVTKSGIEALCSILLPIEKGQMALTWQPPSRVTHDANYTAKWVDWMVDQAHLSEMRGNDLIQECQKRFPRHQEKDVEARIVKDLLVMQSELREEYRRFVIITDTAGPSNTSKEVAASTSASKADIKDGFELTHVKDFVFNDDYFASERS